MIWSETAKREFAIQNFYELSSWKPSLELILCTFLVATVLTYLRHFVQATMISYAERNKIKESKKFSESSWKALFYTISWIWGLYEVWKCDWFPQTFNCWKNFPDIAPMETTLQLFYLFQFGFYWHTLYSHLTVEVERSDYWPLLFHHIVAILLIYVSYKIGFYRIGLLVLVAHDTNDVFLEIGKIFIYTKRDTLTKITFIVMLASWIITRLGIFPFMIIKSTMYESLDYIPWDIAQHLLYYEFNGGLCFLLVLHIYWFGLMLRIVHRNATGKEKGIQDIREKDD